MAPFAHRHALCAASGGPPCAGGRCLCALRLAPWKGHRTVQDPPRAAGTRPRRGAARSAGHASSRARLIAGQAARLRCTGSAWAAVPAAARCCLKHLVASAFFTARQLQANITHGETAAQHCTLLDPVAWASSMRWPCNSGAWLQCHQKRCRHRACRGQAPLPSDPRVYECARACVTSTSAKTGCNVHRCSAIVCWPVREGVRAAWPGLCLDDQSALVSVHRR